MNFWRELLSEDSKLSTTRFLSIVAMLIAGAIAITGILRGADLMGTAALAGVFATTGMGGKVAQKLIEVRKPE